jgi:hypothetical protein
MAMTNSLANMILDHIVGRRASIDVGSDFYCALGTSATAPIPAGTGFTEVSGNGYARVLIGARGQTATLKVTAASAGASANDVQIHFPKATGVWGVVRYFGIYGSAVSTTLLAYGTLTADIEPDTPDVPIIEIGDLTLTLS